MLYAYTRQRFFLWVKLVTKDIVARAIVPSTHLAKAFIMDDQCVVCAFANAVKTLREIQEIFNLLAAFVWLD